MKPESSHDSAALRRAAEARLNEAKTDRPPPTEGDLRRLRHELEVHEVELKMQNENLCAALERYTEHFDFAPVGFFNLTTEGIIKLVNLTGAKLIGLERDRLVGQPFTSHLPAADRPAFIQFLSGIFVTKATDSCEITLGPPGLSARCCLLEATSSPDGQECRAVLIDITERKRAEAAVTAEATRRRILIEESRDGIVILDQDGGVFEANRRFAETLGYSLEEVRNLRVWDWNRSWSQDQVLEAIRALGPEGAHFETRHWRKDGSFFEVELTNSAAVLGSQKLVFCVCRDITARKEAEAALRGSEERWRFALEGAGDGVWDWNIPTSEVVFAKQWRAMFGFSESDIGSSLDEWSQRVHPEDLPQVLADVRAHIAGQTASYANEHRFRCKDGSWKWVLARGMVMGRDAAGQPLRMLGTYTDINERKQAEAALQESNKRLEEITFSLADWVWETNEKGVYTYSSQQGFNYFGPHRDNVIGRTPFDFMPADEVKRVRAIFTETVARKAPIKDLENWIITKNGARICLLTNAVPILDEAGNFKGYRGVDKDITAQRAAEAALRLRGAALEAAANAIVITDRQGVIEWANPAFSSLSGWSLSEAIGRNPRDFLKSGTHDAGFYRQMWNTLLAGKVWHGEIINRRKDGALRTEEMTVTPLRSDQGEISHFIAIKQDITDHKTMQAHFLQAQRMEAIGALAGGIAHDLNNILAPVMMVTSLVKDKLVDEGDRELLAMTHASAQRGGEVIKQLLIFSRGQDGERKVLQPRHLISEMGRMMRETFPREIKVQQQLPAVLWMIHADPTQVHQVLMNLCVNARDAMPDGGQLTVGAANVTLVEGNPRVPPRAKPGPHVVITVSDTGHGIPPQIKHRIFDPFFSTKPLGKGTGLGLSTVLGIVHNHGGFVDVDSIPNEGSTFKVYFPAIPDEVEAIAEVLVAPAVPRLADQTILVVDDERTAREMTRILLERQHYRVLTAVNGEDALVQYLGHRTEITLVLTDLMMPVMNGVNLIRALRVIDPALKIIAMSGLTETVETEKLAALAVPDVLTKPCSGPTILDAVHRRLTKA